MERISKVKAYILDTSVVVKWFSKEEKDSEKALWLRESLFNGGCSITVPALLFYELSNALKHNTVFSAEDIKTAMNSLFDMGIEVKEVDTYIINEAIDIACKFNTTVYDSYFLALAKEVKKPLITADYNFVKRVKSLKGIFKLSEM